MFELVRICEFGEGWPELYTQTYIKFALCYLWILKPFCDGGLPEAAEPGEAGVLAVEADGDGALAVALLLTLETNGKSKTNRVA